MGEDFGLGMLCAILGIFFLAMANFIGYHWARHDDLECYRLNSKAEFGDRAVLLNCFPELEGRANG